MLPAPLSQRLARFSAISLTSLCAVPGCRLDCRPAGARPLCWGQCREDWALKPGHALGPCWVDLPDEHRDRSAESCLALAPA